MPHAERQYQLNVLVPVPLIERARQVCAPQMLSVADLTRSALLAEVKRREQESRQSPDKAAAPVGATQ